MSMTPDDIDRALSARLATGVDPIVPGQAAADRIMRTVAERAAGGRRARGFAGGSGAGLRAALLAAVVALLVGGVLGVSVVALHDRSTGGNPRQGGQVPPPVATQTPTPTASPPATPSPAATPTLATAVPPCDGATLTARLADQRGAAGTDGADIVLHNAGTIACTMEGYTNVQALSNGHAVQLGVTHSIGGTVLNNNNGTLPVTALVAVQPGADAYVAFEYSSVNSGPTQCPSYTALLITPPQGQHSVTVPAPNSLILCGGYGASIWLDEAPVSTTAYFAS